MTATITALEATRAVRPTERWNPLGARGPLRDGHRRGKQSIRSWASPLEPVTGGASSGSVPEVLYRDHTDAFVGRQIEPEYLGVEAELAVQRGPDVLCCAEPVLLAREFHVGDRKLLGS